MSSRGAFIAVEGLSFSGKTSVTTALSDQGCAVRVGELSEFHRDGEHFPPFPSSDVEARNSDIWFLDRECARSHIAEKLACMGAVCADRCFVSCLAFAWARQTVCHVGSYEFVRGQVSQRLLHGDLHLPWIVVLRTALSELERRRPHALEERRRRFGETPVGNVLLDERWRRSFWLALDDFYRSYARRNATRALILDGSGNIADNVHEIRLWAEQLPSKRPDLPQDGDWLPCDHI